TRYDGRGEPFRLPRHIRSRRPPPPPSRGGSQGFVVRAKGECGKCNAIEARKVTTWIPSASAYSARSPKPIIVRTTISDGKRVNVCARVDRGRDPSGFQTAQQRLQAGRRLLAVPLLRIESLAQLAQLACPRVALGGQAFVGGS